tara:strand:- start:54469 stop:54879 length:411 start_codon:yes stop_codon:yes gene_type:complete
MSAPANRAAGWASMPLALKILPFFLTLWALGSAANLGNLMRNGLPLFGLTVDGVTAFAVALFFDFVAPAIFLFGLWNRKTWAPKWATFYIGLFVVNGLVGLVASAEQYGAAQILAPCVVSLVVLAVIWWKRSYFIK